MFSKTLRRRLAGSIALVSLATGAATAEAADIDVKSATITEGKLVIKGTTASPRMRLRLDGQSGEDFNVVSNANSRFAFSLAYLPTDCVVTLQKQTAPSTFGAGHDAVVENCARGLSPRGEWSEAADYSGNDLVTYRGSTWLARRDNASKRPGRGADWQLFAAAADDETAAAQGSKRAGSDGASDGVEAEAAADRPTGRAGGDLTGRYPNPRIRSRAITTGKIRNGAVTSKKIGAGAVNNHKLGDGSVSTSKIQVGAVTTEKIADGAITALKILDGAVTSAGVLDEALTSLDLGPDSVGASEIAADSVGSSEIAPNVVGADELDLIHEHFSAVTNITDTTAHDGAYGFATATVTCGVGEDLLSVSVDWIDDNGHNETVFGGVNSINRAADDNANVRVAFDGGGGAANPATFQAVATCIF